MLLSSHQYPICMAVGGGDLIRSNYFIDSFSGPYHCSFPSIKHMPGWIMWPDTVGCFSQTKDHKTASLRCLFMSCFRCYFFLNGSTPRPLLFFRISTLNPLPPSRSAISPQAHSLPPILFIALQARRLSRPSGLSPGTSLCKWEQQLCWGARCSGPQGPCSGWKMASSWDLREVCQAFHATAWSETSREVSWHGISSTVCWIFMGLLELKKKRTC